MLAKCIESFSGVEDGKVYPRLFNPGEIIEGDLAREAIVGKWAVLHGDKVVVLDKAPVNPAKPAPAAPVADKADLSVYRAAFLERIAAEVPPIPVDWKSFKWTALRALAEKISGKTANNPDEARRVIEAEIASRAKS